MAPSLRLSEKIILTRADTSSAAWIIDAYRPRSCDDLHHRGGPLPRWWRFHSVGQEGQLSSTTANGLVARLHVEAREPHLRVEGNEVVRALAVILEHTRCSHSIVQDTTVLISLCVFCHMPFTMRCDSLNGRVRTALNIEPSGRSKRLVRDPWDQQCARSIGASDERLRWTRQAISSLVSLASWRGDPGAVGAF